MLQSLIISLILMAASPLFAGGAIPDPKLEIALSRVFHSNSISFKTCLENIQVLIRSAIKTGAELSNAEVVIFYSPGEFLRPNSARWPQVPHYDFHVVLMKDGWIYDFAAESASVQPEIHKVRDYLLSLFPRNKLKDFRFKVVPALQLLFPEHRKLPMSDHDTYSFIKKVWKQKGLDYKKVAFRGDTETLTYQDLVSPRRGARCSKLFSTF